MPWVAIGYTSRTRIALATSSWKLLQHSMLTITKSLRPTTNSKAMPFLPKLRKDLAAAGFSVETGKKKKDLIEMPVLFQEQGRPEKVFYADAYEPIEQIVLEVEAGRATVNYQFLKDFFEACMMLDASYLCIAIRNVYVAGKAQTKSEDYRKVCTFFKTLYASNRLAIPLKGILIIGY